MEGSFNPPPPAPQRNKGKKSLPASPSSRGRTQADLKIIILGSGRVGKTSFIQRYINDSFNAETLSSLGASHLLKKWKSFFISIWDTPGQSKYNVISEFYYRNANAAILSFDLTDRESFLHLKSYIEPLKRLACKRCQIVVVGTKLDLVEDGEYAVSAEEIEQFTDDVHATFFPSSSKDNVNVSPVFDQICYQNFATRLSQSGSSSGESDDSIKKLGSFSSSSCHSNSPAPPPPEPPSSAICCMIQ